MQLLKQCAAFTACIRECAPTAVAGYRLAHPLPASALLPGALCTAWVRSRSRVIQRGRAPPKKQCERRGSFTPEKILSGPIFFIGFRATNSPWFLGGRPNWVLIY